ncbi:imelysin family protein [Leptospira sp. 'Mane']|uniref:imelysin family protein n=1 Tax=Leptospira sp. 'Mane' TaxID=3387407 RepID=UPI00398BA601
MKFKNLILIPLILLSCQKHKNNATEDASLQGSLLTLATVFKTSDFLKNTAENVILISYQKVQTETKVFQNICTTFKTNPNTNSLNEIRLQWKIVWKEVKRIEIYRFGPAENVLNGYGQLESFTQKLPISPSEIESAINSNSIPFGVKKSGWGAIEYLLFSGIGGVFSLNQFQTDPNRGNYLCKIADKMVSVSDFLVNSWSKETTDNFYIQFLSPGSSGSSYESQADVVDELMNQSIFLLTSVIDTKLGLPSGLLASSHGMENWSQRENPYAESSLESVRSNLESILFIMQGGLNGSTGKGFTKVLQSKGSTLGTEIETEIQSAIKLIDSLQYESGYLSLHSAFTDRNKSFRELFESARKLRILFSTGVTSALGTTVGVSSNDGD